MPRPIETLLIVAAVFALILAIYANRFYPGNRVSDTQELEMVVAEG